MNLSALKDWKTTVVGLLLWLSLMPQNDAIQHFMSMSPKAANVVTVVAGIATGGVLIFKAISPGGVAK
jgi:hypothetical protein